MWHAKNIFTLALAEMLVIGATLSWPPQAQALSIFATFFLFVSLYLMDEEDGE
jgi:hypothetical protein